MKEPIVLLTRPAEQSEALARSLAPARTVISPIIEIVPLDVSVDPDAYDFLIFSSANAVAAARSLGLAGKGAIAVGERTAAAARSAGMDAIAAGGNAKELIATVLENRPAGRALFLRGRHSRGNIARELGKGGVEVDEIVVYDQRARPLTAEAQELLKGQDPVVIPLFSPRSAALVAEELKRAHVRATLAAIAMSESVADEWARAGMGEASVVPRPDAKAMLAGIGAELARWG